MDLPRIWDLVQVFAPLSLVSFGGGQSVFSEMQRQMVDVHHWMSNAEYVDLFAISRAAPGPGTLIAALLGWKLAGWAGAIASILALYVPSSVLAYAAGLWWRHHRGSPMLTIVQNALMPVAVGLIFAGALSLIEASHAGWLQLLTTAITCLVVVRRLMSPYLLMLIAALLYGVLGAAGGLSPGG